MRLWSDSFEHRGRIPAEFAMGTPDGFGGNRNPHLAWADAPEGTQSFVLLCIDTDAPTDASTVGRDDLEIPVEQPRADFVHWVMVDIPAERARDRRGQLQRRRHQARQARPAGPAGRAPGPATITPAGSRRRRHARRLPRLRRPVSAVQRPAPASLFLPPVRAARAESSTCRRLHRGRCASMRCSRTRSPKRRSTARIR